jgi:hypothetical protein
MENDSTNKTSMPEFPHMCKMDHIEIGHRDSSREDCPLCRLSGVVDAAREIASMKHPSISEVLTRVGYGYEARRIEHLVAEINSVPQELIKTH